MLFFPTKSTDFADFHPKMKINVRNKTIYYYSTVVELQNRRRGCDRPAISLYCTASIQGSLNTSISARVAVDLQSFMVGHWLVVVGRVDELWSRRWTQIDIWRSHCIRLVGVPSGPSSIDHMERDDDNISNIWTYWYFVEGVVEYTTFCDLWATFKFRRRQIGPIELWFWGKLCCHGFTGRAGFFEWII